ncbi:MAG TPA: hypothetical protein VIL40_02585, partial [Thermaerobacter sp.]
MPGHGLAADPGARPRRGPRCSSLREARRPWCHAALQQRVGGVGPAARASRGRPAGIAPAVLVLFDLLGLGGAVWLPRPLGERVHRLERLFPQGSAPGVALSRGVEG